MKKLNFGCGTDIRKGWDNVDKNDFNFNNKRYPIKNDIYDYIYINRVLEYIQNIPKMLKELHRISKPNAKIIIKAPHYTNKGAYSSLEHSHYLNEIAFKDYINRENAGFIIEEIKLIPTKIGRIFPFILRNHLSKFINGLIETIYIRLKVIKN